MLGADTGYILSSQAKLSKSLRLNQLMWDAPTIRLSCCGNSHPFPRSNFHSSRHTLPPSHALYSGGKDPVLNEKCLFSSDKRWFPPFTLTQSIPTITQTLLCFLAFFPL